MNEIYKNKIKLKTILLSNVLYKTHKKGVSWTAQARIVQWCKQAQHRFSMTSNDCVSTS